jgi:cell division septation protein DedD
VTVRPQAEDRGRILATAPPPPNRPTLPEAPQGRFAVQLGAFASVGRAQSLRDRVTELGVEARLVRMPNTQLIHVRAGRFDSEQAARDLLAAIELIGFTGGLVRDADTEEAVAR